MKTQTLLTRLIACSTRGLHLDKNLEKSIESLDQSESTEEIPNSLKKNADGKDTVKSTLNTENKPMPHEYMRKKSVQKRDRNKKLENMLLNPNSYSWKDFLSNFEASSTSRVIYHLWQHTQKTNSAVNRRPLPLFPRTFLSYSYSWILSECQKIGPQQNHVSRNEGAHDSSRSVNTHRLRSIEYVPPRNAQATILLIRKTMKFLMQGDPYERADSTKAVGQAKWLTAISLCEQVFNAYQSVLPFESRKSYPAPILSAASPNELSVVLHHAADIIAPSILQILYSMDEPNQSQSQKHGHQRHATRSCNRQWHVALRVFSLTHEHGLLLLWKRFQSLTGSNPACSNSLDKPTSQPHGRVTDNFVKLGVNNLSPFLVLIRSCVRAYFVESTYESISSTSSAVNILANRLVEIFRLIKSFTPLQGWNDMRHFEDHLPAFMDTFLLQELVRCLDVIPDAWVVYNRLFRDIFYVNCLSESMDCVSDGEVSPIKANDFSSLDEISFGDGVIVYLMRQKRYADSPDRNVGPESKIMLFSKRSVARQYQNALHLLFGGMLTNLAWHSKKASFDKMHAPIPLWRLACTSMLAVHSRLQSIAHTLGIAKSSIILREKVLIPSTVFLRPHPFRTHAYHAVFTLLGKAKKVEHIKYLYEMHIEMERNAALEAYFHKLLKALYNRKVSSFFAGRSCYEMLLRAQIANIVKTCGITLQPFLVCTGPQSKSLHWWKAISKFSADGDYSLPKEAYISLESTEVQRSIKNFLPLDAVKLEKPSTFPLLYLLQLSIQRRLIPEVAVKAMQTHGKYLKIDELHEIFALMHESRFSWSDAVLVYAQSVLQKGKKSVKPNSVAQRELYKSLFDFFFRDGMVFFTNEAQKNGTKDHFFILFVLYRHFVLSTIRQEGHGNVPLSIFQSIAEDRKYIVQNLTLVASRALIAMNFHLRYTYFDSAAAKYPRDHPVNLVINYKNMLSVDIQNITPHRDACVRMVERQPFTSFFIEYMGMIQMECMSFLHLTSRYE